MLGQKAFETYCSQVVRDAAVKNDEIRAENASLQNIRKHLLSMKLCSGVETLKTVNILEDDHLEDDTHLFFPCDPIIDVPLDSTLTAKLYGRISGLFCGGSRLAPNSKTPTITVDLENEKVELEVFLSASNSVTVTGLIQNVNGTLDEVEYLASCNHHSFFFSGGQAPMFPTRLDSI